MYCAAVFRKMPTPRRLVPGTLRWTQGRTWVRHQPPSGQHRCLRCGRRSGFSGTPWSRSSTLCLWSRCFTTLCRRWWNSWWTFSHLSISVLPSRLSKYPESCVHPVLLALSSVRRRWRNSWWKCPRSCPSFLFSSRLWCRTLTFQFVVVEGETSIFKVFFPDRVQQRRLLRRSLTILLLVDLRGFRPGQSSSASFSSPAGVHDYADEPGEGVFRTFPRGKKSPKSAARPSPRVPASGSSWTRAAYGQGTVADDDDDGVEGFFEDDAGNVWTKTSKHTWLDPLGQSWLHVRRQGAFYWWNLDTQHTQWLPPWYS